MLNNPTFFLDLVTASWVIVISSLLFIFLPSWLLKSDRHRSWSSRAASGFVRIFTLITLGSLIWIMLGLFNWFTACSTLLMSVLMLWSFTVQRHHQQRLQQFGQNLLIAIIDLGEQGIALQHINEVVAQQWRQSKRALSNPTAIVASIAISIVAILAVYLRFSHPLSELRFSQPGSYGQLLTIQQILGRDRLQLDYLPVFPALIAFISLLSGVDAIHTQHFGAAVVGCWLVMALGYGLWGLTRSISTSAVVMLGLGAYLFTWSGEVPTFRSERIQGGVSAIIGSLNQGLIRQWNPSEVEIGTLFLVLGVVGATQIAKRHQRTDGWIDTICCVLVLMMTAPSLLFLFLVGGLGMVLGPRVALLAIGISWLLAALLTAIPHQQLPLDPIFLTTLPVGLSLLLGMGFLLVTEALKGLLSIWAESLCLMLVMAIAVNFWLPSGQLPNYLEYDAAARKTLEISNFFPYKTWTLVAPVEQFPQSYYQGWYEDLAKFVTAYQERVSTPGFRWPLKTPYIFVLVEKKPFGADRAEPEVPYSVFADPVYRNYRSASGRTKLQTAALQMCETYAKNHPDSKVYYEDRVIKIYQFRGQPAPQK